MTQSSNSKNTFPKERSTQVRHQSPHDGNRGRRKERTIEVKSSASAAQDIAEAHRPKYQYRMRMQQAQSREEIALARMLFLEYADWLGSDLSFQEFDPELASLPGAYAPPPGRLLLAIENGELVGCGALRPLEEGVAELKRMFVRLAFRGKGIGRTLARTLLDEARAIGYERIRLDTMKPMQEAIALYRSLGFKEIEPYCYNPLPGAIFMELALRLRSV